MLWSNYKGKIDTMRFKITAQLITIVFLSLALTVSSFVSYSSFRSKRTVIIPSTINAALEISDIDASPSFLKTSIFYALSLLYSYTPDSVTARYQEFLVSFVDSSKIQELREDMSDRINSINKTKISQSFEPEEIVYIRNGVALVSGRLFPSVLGQAISTDVLFLQVEYRIVSGNLRITGVTQLNQTDYERLKRMEKLDSQKMVDEEKRRIRNKASLERSEQRQKEADMFRGPKGFGFEDDLPSNFNPNAITQDNFGNALEE